MKKWFKILGLGLLATLLLAVVLVEVNKKKILQAVIDRVNQTIDGEMSYDDSDVSLLRSFPNLRVVLKDALIEPSSPIHPPLAHIGELAIDIDLIGLIRSRDLIQIEKIFIREAKIQAVTQKDLSNNYTLVQTTPETSTASSGANLKINQLIIDDCSLTWIDHHKNTTLSLDDLSTTSNINLQSGVYTIKSDMITNVIAEISRALPDYKVRLQSKNTVTLSDDFDHISLLTEELLINDLPIQLNGTINHLHKKGSYQVEFKSPKAAIKKLLSLIPAIYVDDYENIISDGSYQLKGSVQGQLVDPYPTYDIEIKTRDGVFYLPQTGAIKNNISLDLSAHNYHPTTLYSRIDIKHLDFQSGKSKAQGDISVSRSTTGENIRSDLSATLNLEEIAKNIFSDQTHDTKGVIDAEFVGMATLKGGKLSNINNGDNFKLALQADDLSVSSKKFKFQTDSISLLGNSRTASVYGKDITFNELFDGDIKGEIDAPLGLIFSDGSNLKGDIDIHANTINLLTENAIQDTTQRTGWDVPTSDVDVTLSADKITYGEYLFHQVKGNGTVTDGSSTFQFTTEDFKGSKISGSAELDKLLDYTFNNKQLDGKVTLISDKIILDEFLNAEETTVQENEILNIPKNINLNIEYKSEAVQFKNINIANNLGEVGIKNQEVIFKTDGYMLGGHVSLIGKLTPEAEGYDLGLVLDLSKLKLGETANTIKVFSKIVPIAELLEGIYTANLTWSSKLDRNYIPDLNSLTAKGSFETTDGSLRGDLPIDTFFRKLVHTQERRPVIKLDNGKKYFTVTDGDIHVQNIGIHHDGIKYKLRGKHSFDQKIDYNIYTDIPRSKLNANKIIDYVTNTIKFDELIKNASDDLKVQVVATMTGTVTKPKFGIKSINLKNGNVVENITDQVMATAEAAKDSIETEIKNTIDSAKAEGTQFVDSIKSGVETVVDSTITSLEDLIKQEEEALKQDGQELLDSIAAGNFDSLGVQLDKILGKGTGILDSLNLPDSLPIKLPGDILKKPKGILDKIKGNG